MEFEIWGRVVRSDDGRGVAGARVEAWDKDPLVDDCLDSADTDANGSFTIRFREDAFSDLGLEQLPDVYLKVFRAGQLLANTEGSLLCNLDRSPIHVTIGATIPADPPVSTDRPVRRFIDGLPRPTASHPRVALLLGGSAIAIADGQLVSAYRIDRHGESAKAVPLWRHETHACIRHLVSLIGGGAVAVTETDTESAAVILDAGGARPLTTFQGSVRARMAACLPRYNGHPTPARRCTRSIPLRAF
jgi:hypothetical protein